MQLLSTFERKVNFRVQMFTHALSQTGQFKPFLGSDFSLNVAIDKFKSPLVEFNPWPN